jgi:hypothetical protein
MVSPKMSELPQEYVDQSIVGRSYLSSTVATVKTEFTVVRNYNATSIYVDSPIIWKNTEIKY